jgi:hypothetical protein
VAKLRLTDAQVRNQRAQALRAARRLERQVDTQLEKIERKYDRAIENKERITIRLALGIADDFRVFVEKVNNWQRGLADMLNIFNSSQ